MGLLKHLLFWPITGPLFLTRFSLEKVQGAVREELTDDSRIKSGLLELQLLVEVGDLDEEEFVRREADLMRQLREVREWRQRFEMGVAGGPVRVAQPAPGAAPEEVHEAVEEAVEETPPQKPPEVARPDSAEIDVKLDFD